MYWKRRMISQRINSTTLYENESKKLTPEWYTVQHHSWEYMEAVTRGSDASQTWATDRRQLLFATILKQETTTADCTQWWRATNKCYYTLNSLPLSGRKHTLSEFSKSPPVTSYLQIKQYSCQGHWYVKFTCFVLLAVSEEAKTCMTSIFFVQCIIKQFNIRFGFCDIQINQGLGKDYNPYLRVETS